MSPMSTAGPRGAAAMFAAMFAALMVTITACGTDDGPEPVPSAPAAPQHHTFNGSPNAVEHSDPPFAGSPNAIEQDAQQEVPRALGGKQPLD